MEERVSAESVTDLRTAKFGIQKTRTSQYVFEYKNIRDPVKNGPNRCIAFLWER